MIRHSRALCHEYSKDNSRQQDQGTGQHRSRPGTACGNPPEQRHRSQIGSALHECDDPHADTGKRTVFHDLRHETASRFAPRMTAQTLAKVMGWKTIQMAMRYYNPTDSELVEVVRRAQRVA